MTFVFFLLRLAIRIRLFGHPLTDDGILLLALLCLLGKAILIYSNHPTHVCLARYKKCLFPALEQSG